MFRSLLVPVDLAPGTERVVERVALLPLAEGARLALMHVVPLRLPPDARRRAEADARKALGKVAKELAGSLHESVVIEQIVESGASAAEIARVAKSLKAELVVMGRGGGRAFRDAFLGSTAERVIRQARRPVLVVRAQARSPYRRPLLALDFDQAAQGALAWLLRLVEPERARMSLVHAYDIPFDGQIYPSLPSSRASEYRRHYRQQLLERVRSLLASAQSRPKPSSAPERPIPWKPYVRYGSPRTVIPQAVAKARADLLVLGTHGYSGVAQAFLGTVAGDVLREASCDVLVVPPRRG